MAIFDATIPSIAKRQVAVMSSPPTVTWSTTLPTTGRRVGVEELTLVGRAVSWNDTSRVWSVQDNAGMYGVRFRFDGASFIFGWTCKAGTKERFQIFVDGAPVSGSLLTPSVTTTTSTQYYMSVDFGAGASREIEILGTNMAALYGIVVPSTASISAARRRAKIHVVGDSFHAGAATMTGDHTVPTAVSLLTYDADISCSAQGGSGYVKPGSLGKPFGHEDRVEYAATIQPDVIVFMGSINDDSETGVQAAAEACFTAYRAACPSARIVAFGPQPNGAVSTVSDARKLNCAAVQAAAAAAGIRYIDMIGFTYGEPSEFVSSTVYPPGAIVSRLGALWTTVRTADTSYPNAQDQPGGYNGRWKLLTLDLWGAGYVGSTTGVGTRDLLLGSDQIHPTDAYAARLGLRVVDEASIQLSRKI